DLLMSSGSSTGSAGLDAAAKKLDQGWLKDQPPTEAACRVALGYSYLSLTGIPTSESATMARRQFTVALQLLRKPDGSYPPAGAATVYRALGMLDMREKDYATASRQFDDALSMYRKVPESEMDQADLMAQMAVIDEARQQHDQARKARLAN